MWEGSPRAHVPCQWQDLKSDGCLCTICTNLPELSVCSPSKQVSLVSWLYGDFMVSGKFRRMTSFSQENFRRKIHLDAPSPGLISLTWRSVVIPVIPYIESDLLGELQLWVRILRTKGSQLLKQKHHRRRQKHPEEQKESEMLLQEPSQSLVSTWGCKNMCTIIPWHISLVVRTLSSSPTTLFFISGQSCWSGIYGRVDLNWNVWANATETTNSAPKKAVWCCCLSRLYMMLIVLLMAVIRMVMLVSWWHLLPELFNVEIVWPQGCAVGPKSNSPFDMYFVPIFAGFSAFSSWWYIVLSIDNIQQCQWPPFRTGRSPGWEAKRFCKMFRHQKDGSWKWKIVKSGG